MTPEPETEKEQPKNASSNSLLVGFVRLSDSKKAIKVSIDKDTLDKCPTYKSKKGNTFVQGIIPVAKLKKVLSGDWDSIPLTVFKNGGD